MKKNHALTPVVAVLCSAMLWGQPAPPAPPPGQSLAPDQLDGLVAPIALYLGPHLLVEYAGHRG